jgi:hypothetical protein
MDRVGRLKESFDRYSRINCFINNSVGHLFREVGGSPGTTNKEYAQLGDPSRIMTCLIFRLMILYF